MREPVDIDRKIRAALGRATGSLSASSALVATDDRWLNLLVSPGKPMELGLELDPVANSGNALTVSRATSRVPVAVEPTDEEWIAASHALRVRSDEMCDAPQR